jgi:hypothetical protein
MAEEQRNIVREALFRRATVGFDRQGFDTDVRRATSARPGRIRCPVCQWQPKRNSRWYCLAMGAPEFFDGGCGSVWNTFETAGRCPGCKHQWTFTSCLSCGVASRHIDWYEADGKATD